FRFTPREAEIMDPQHRFFLEECWSALEDAGYGGRGHAGRVGVYAGESMSSYLLANLYPRPELIESAGAMLTYIGNDKDFLSTQVSYKLDLKGPSLTVQTACSTSLVAVHLACQSLLARECDTALAGGATVAVPQRQGGYYREGGIISPDGHCRAFDARAQGMVKGNGVAVVVLKRLADALADGDHVYAVIKGSAINNDGSSKVGYTAPSVEGQAAAIEEAQAVAGVDPATITYVEAHGTGTALGDPIEVAALTQAFRAGGAGAKQFCGLGSVKTNIGHTDAAAGVAGLIKTVLALRHGEIPPSLNFTSPNPNIDFAGSPFYVNAELRPWASDGSPRRAGVSSFGVGGTNAHVVLEEAPAARPSSVTKPAHLLTLSARTETALGLAARNLAEFLESHPEESLADVAYTLQVGRREFGHRRALVAGGAEEAAAALRALDSRRVHAGEAGEDEWRQVVFMFSGQGSQYVRMGQGLYETEPTYREEIDRCAGLLRPRLGFDLREVLYPQARGEEEAAARLAETGVTQPALFAVEYALARLWMSWGVRPAAVIGHSLGEFTAACVAGVFSLEEALVLVAERGRLMQQAPAGAMLAVQLPEADVLPLLGEGLGLAAVNAPSMCVVSGTAEAVGRVERKLTEGGVVCRRLHVSHALHSPAMEAAVAPFVERVKAVALRAPQLPYVSTLTGRAAGAGEVTDPHYWGRHLREAVRFADGVAELLKEPGRVLLEIGPGQTLGALARQQTGAANAPHAVLGSLRHPRDGQSDPAYLLNTLAQLWTAGVPVEWPALHAHEPRRRTSLPTYPFERRRYWVEPPSGQGAVAQAAPARKADAAEWFYVPSWKRTVTPGAGGGQGEQALAASWLIFSGAGGLGVRVAEKLEAGGASAYIVGAGAQFREVDGRGFEIDPRSAADYGSLLRELRARDKFPERILHLWNTAPEAAGGDALAAAHELGLDSLIYLAQALGEYGVGETVRIGVVTDGVYDVTGGETLSPEKALLLGPCKVIPQEYAGVSCLHIDVATPPAGVAEEGRLVEALITELSVETKDGTVAYRGRHRWAQTFEPVRWPLSEAVGFTGAARGARLREGGVYLLTGCLSEIDLALAERLAAEARARLVFAGRADFPPREAWGRWLETHGDEDETAGLIRRLSALEEIGAQVHVARTDVAGGGQMRALVSEARGRFGAVNGVVHSASVEGGGVVQSKTPEMMRAALAPKVEGTLALRDALEAPGDAPPDFFALFSSSLALTGVFGQVDYCAGNAFLDAFAHAHNARGETYTFSVDWHVPRWELWQESAAGSPALRERIARAREEYGVPLAEGVAAFFRILASGEPQVVVSAQDFAALVEAQGAGGGRLLGQLGEAARPAAAGESADYAAPTGELEVRVAAVWQELFGIERIGVNDNFFELGGDSLLAIQLVSRLRKSLEVELPLSGLLQAPTVAGVTAAIEEMLSESQEDDEVERLLREIEALSPDELQASLARELGPGEEANRNG
ncbi:MAG TPA: acyltransferase domain-containing protein, partial [Pyrinomonadaceae bacterium]